MPFFPKINADKLPETPSFLLWPPTSIPEIGSVMSLSVASIPITPMEPPNSVLNRTLDFFKESKLDLEETLAKLGVPKIAIILLEKIQRIEFKERINEMLIALYPRSLSNCSLEL